MVSYHKLKSSALLAKNDISLAANADAMLAKNRIIEAVYQLFGRLADTFRAEATGLPEPVNRQHPKISKGENYLGLPWVMLDYPRNFNGPDIFAVRTMFWWGHHFSLQLLLQGRYLPLLNRVELMNPAYQKEWFFCTGDTPWQHHFEVGYMQPLYAITPAQIQLQKEKYGFYKVGVKLPVEDWEIVETFLTQNFFAALRLILPAPDVSIELAAGGSP